MVLVECCKDVDVIDEILMVYKDIDQVMDVQCELVEVVYILCQVVCVKGQEDEVFERLVGVVEKLFGFW